MFTASKSSILDALRLVSQIVERRNTIPILQNVLIDLWGNSGKLTARVSDLDVEATVPFAATVDTDFRGFTIPAHMLMDIVKKLPDGADVRVEATDADLSSVTIKSGCSRFRLSVLSPHDFPSLEGAELPFSVEIPAAALERAITSVRFAISTEETRYYLNGIFFHPAPTGLKLVATDGHRLSKRFIPLDDVPQDMPGIIIPKKTVEAIAKHLPKEGSITLQVSDAKIRLLIGDMVLLSKLIDGTFPDYQRVIPNNEAFIEIEGKQLAAAIDRVSTVSTGNGRAVKMTFAGGSLKLQVSNPDAGNAEDEVAYEGDADLETGFNAKYVNDALANLSDSTIRMHLGETGSPAVLRADGDHVENVIVLMPMRV
ncbi:DNA polymerase III subunit beta [Pseudorhizobium pelagicum]|uniref:Beta sliding clamp n=1 Tax=Pseudorhizobium pelagicum TaxID=1509405 RepID=A0A922NZ59_9HYPH|nr:DNA polymerase III subunit beta [Pseudorhizobium pelagicum]KEQ05722.1 DNA polymerase III subunit beta [Pseudorhizobium pelagicum]KEQ06402.1 DNA polymerase III subunit beta [Pseudorhizobium pelagicum]